LLPPSVQTPSLHRHSPDHRSLSAKNAGSRLPLPWLQPRPPSKNRAHLPLDALPHSRLFLLGPGGFEPLPVTSQHLLCEHYPAPPPGRSYPQLKLQCRSLLIKEWEESAPDPARYPYRPSIKPHPFMGLNKFTAGRLHQMRSGKSYLRAHPSWSDDAPNIPVPAVTRPPRPSSMPYSAAPRRDQPEPATFRGSLTSVPTLPFGLPSPCLGPSAASLARQPQPSPRACSHVRRPQLVLFLPSHLM